MKYVYVSAPFCKYIVYCVLKFCLMATKFIGPGIKWNKEHTINVQLQCFELRQQGTIGTAPGKHSVLRYKSEL